MATAQYDTRTRTVEETVVVLTLTEDEAVELRQHIEKVPVSGVVYRVYEALIKPTPPEQPAPAADTFEYDGVTYELGATYRDRTGDFFKIESDIHPMDGTPRARLWDPDAEEFGSLNWTLASVVSSWSPLTKANP